MHFLDARETFEPTQLPSNVVPLNTSPQVNAQTTAALLITCPDADLADLVDRLRGLYLAQIDRADETLRALIKAQHEQRNRGHG